MIRRGTYSIVARDAATGELGVAVQSHWFAVGPIVPWVRSGVGDATLARVRRRLAARVDDRDLAKARQLVVARQRVESRAGAVAGGQPLQRARAVGRLGDRLRGHRTDPGAHPWHHRPDREPMRLHRHAELAGGGVASDN